MPPPVEDLPALAAAQFARATLHCSSCRPYHALWGYLRLTRQVGGVEADEPHLAPLLGQMLGHGHGRVLIAGSADSGVTAMVHRAAVGAGASPRITVVDRCATPLLACQHFAAAHGIDLRVIRADLLDSAVDGEFDLIVAHSVLQFFTVHERRMALSTLRRLLSPRGQLLMVSRLASPDRDRTEHARAPDEWARALVAGIRGGLVERNLEPPFSPAELGEVVNDYVRRNGFHVSPHESEQALLDDLAGAGYRIDRMMPVGRGLEFMKDGNVSRTGRQGIVAIASNP